MSKPKMRSPDLAEANVEKIAALFPNCVTESRDDKGQLRRAVDFDLLRQELAGTVVEGPVERYTLNWPGKREAIVAANAPVFKTLRPCEAESVDFEKTRNLYIEGDNLEVLKLLQETYLGQVKMIYIDPPYNTGNDFIYDDDFTMDKGRYELGIEYRDEVGNIQFRQNNEANPRFHSDWLSMMYPRLKLARDLLKDDGVIFISIDDNEVHNLRKLCDEVFGATNFVCGIVWQKIHSTKNDAKYLSVNHEHLLVYTKNIENYSVALLPRTEKMNARYANPDNDTRGVWQSGDLVASGERKNGHYAVISPTTGKSFDVEEGKHWVYSEENMRDLIADNRIWFGVDGNAFPRKKRFLTEVQQGRTANTLWLSEEVGHNQSAAREVKSLFGGAKLFDFPKPVAYLRQMLILSETANDVVLDFFSGSATTAHAVMQLNAEDGGNRRFIMVQLPEACDEKSEAFKAGYKNICEIGKERIRRAGKKIKEENATTAPNLDIGFRVFKADSSNMKDVYYTPDEVEQATLELAEDPIKEDRTAEDLLFQIFLDFGLDLALPVAREQIDGKTVFVVDGRVLLACFDSNIPESLVTAMARRQPLKAVFLDRSFANDSGKINVVQIFKQLAPDTTVKIV